MWVRAVIKVLSGSWSLSIHWSAPRVLDIVHSHINYYTCSELPTLKIKLKRGKVQISFCKWIAYKLFLRFYLAAFEVHYTVLVHSIIRLRLVCLAKVVHIGLAVVLINWYLFRKHIHFALQFSKHLFTYR